MPVSNSQIELVAKIIRQNQEMTTRELYKKIPWVNKQTILYNLSFKYPVYETADGKIGILPKHGEQTILGFCLFDGSTQRFSSIEEAEKETLISRKRIKWLIRTGHKWKGWTFDILENE